MQVGTSTLLPRPTGPVLPYEVAVDSVRQLVPDFIWLQGVFAKQPPWLRFPSYLIKGIENLRLQNYPRLYENEFSLNLSLLRVVYDESELKEKAQALELAPLEARAPLFAEISKDLNEVFDFSDMPKTRREWVRLRRLVRGLPVEIQGELWSQARKMWGALLPNFHNVVSILLHGENLPSLIAKAKTGKNDDAYLKAIQTDIRIFNVVPEFRTIYEKALQDGRQDFCEAVTRRLFSSPFKGQIKRPAIHIALAMFDAVGWLKPLSNPELMDALDEAGFDKYPEAISGPKGLAKCRREHELRHEIVMESTQHF